MNINEENVQELEYLCTINPNDFLDTAERFRARYYKHNGLVYHSPHTWRKWNGKKYLTLHEVEIEAEVSAYLSQCEYRVFRNDKGKITANLPPEVPLGPFASGDEKGTVESQEVKSNMKMRKEIISELRNVCLIDADTSYPSWIGKEVIPPKNVIAFDNGLLDIERYLQGDDTLIPHSSRWYSPCCLPHKYDSTAHCPRWLAFLDEVFEGDRERVRLLQQWFGYGLTSDTSLEKYLILFGKSRSGKSTIAEVFTASVGRENVGAAKLRSFEDRFTLGTFVGKSMIIPPDAHLPRRGDTSGALELIKAITGNDAVNIEMKYKDTITGVRLNTKIMLMTNELPAFLDKGGALAERTIILPFDVSFAGREDTQLKSKLIEEISGVTLWALEGLRDLREQGSFVIPEVSKEALESYRETLSPIKEFFDSFCISDSEETVSKDNLYLLYRHWCNDEGHHAVAKTRLISELKTIDGKIRSARPRNSGGPRSYHYTGIKLNYDAKRFLSQFGGVKA